VRAARVVVVRVRPVLMAQRAASTRVVVAAVEQLALLAAAE
jgi:hypothetical protein